MLGSFIDNAQQSGFSLDLVGLVNAESGNIGIGTRAIDYCDVCNGQSLDSPQFDCGVCWRQERNYLFTTAGDGDGIYTVWKLSQRGTHHGILSVYDSNYFLANTIREAIDQPELPRLSKELVAEIAPAKTVSLGTMDVAGVLKIADVWGDSDNVELTIEGLAVGTYRGWAFIEPANTSTGPLAPRNVDSVRAVAVLSEDCSGQLGLEEEMRMDWAGHLPQTMAAIVTSHREPMGESVREVNNVLDPRNTPSIWDSWKRGLRKI